MGREGAVADGNDVKIDPDHAQALERQRLRRERKPLSYCKLITNHPIKSFLVTLSAHILTVIISVVMIGAGYDLMPVDFENLPMEINDQPWRPRELAWQYREGFPGYYDRTPSGGYRYHSYPRANIDLYYDGKGDNVFTRENLKAIQAVENELTSVPGYKSDYCQLDPTKSNGTCEKPRSILRYFDGTFVAINPVFNDTHFDNITAVLFEASTNPKTNGDFRFFLGKSSSVTRTAAYSSITRSVIPMGYPLKGYSDPQDYEKLMRTWSFKNLKTPLESIRKDNKHFDFAYRSDMLWLEDVFTQAMKDTMFAIGSICFIFLLILFHTRSLWVSGFAIMSILTSFVCTNLIYRVVFDFRYLGFFHVLTLFIVLGIGADDIFVFYDVWRNTAGEKYTSLAHRLSDAYRKSVFSMLFTSITTATAFFASTISPLLATRSFGVFSGLVIIVNYLSVILFFPTVVVVYHLKFERFQWPCVRFFQKTCKGFCTCTMTCCSYGKNGTSTRGQDNCMHDLTRVNGHAVENGHSQGHAGEAKSDKETSRIKPKKKSKVALFFRDKYSRFVTHKHIRWAILLGMVAIVIFFSVQASKLEPENEGVKVLKDSHVYSVSDKHAINSFTVTKTDRNIIIYIVWGMLENDMSDCHFSTPMCLGERRWDSTFNPSSDAAQNAMLNLCNKMKNFTEAEGSKMKIKKDYTGQWQINCYMNNLNAYLQKNSYSTPFTYANANAFMTSHNQFYNASLFNSSYTDHLEIPISHWLSNGHNYSNLPTDFYLFNHLIGEEVGPYTQELKTDTSRRYGNNIKFVGIQVNTSLVFETLGYTEGIPIMDMWEDFVNQEMKSMPPEMNKAFQTTQFIWHWLIVSKMLEENAIYGIVIGVCLAFPILVIATGNIITGFLATVSMGCSTVCVVGVIPLGGWKLGALVSLNMCMVVGLTVDYVVHLAEAYTQSLHHDRMSRLRDMLEEMAVSVFFGAITTLGASLFMFLAQLSFFMQFGIFMFSTIGFSLFFSMGLFVTLMGLVGPEGDTGKIKKMCKKLKEMC